VTPEGTIFIYRANERAYAELVVTHRAILPTLVVNDERFKVAQHAFPQIYWNCSFSVVEGQRTQMVEQKPYPMWERSDPKVELISCLRKMRVGLHQLQLRAAARPPAQDEPR
jgi:hypothetical protein